jgi:hypothetical protein
MPEQPRPGIPQSEKDRLGAALREAEARTAAAASTQPHADDGLDGLTKNQLAVEAARQGVAVKADATKQDIISALRGQAAEPAAPEE